jgi:hypothetical protein
MSGICVVRCVLVKKSDSAFPECVGVKNVRFSMSGMCCGQKCQIQHVWSWSKCQIMSGICGLRNARFSMPRNMSWSKMSDSACLECVLVKMSDNVWNFWVKKRQIQHAPEYIVVKNVRFSMSGMCPGQKCQIQHVRNACWAKTSDSTCSECVIGQKCQIHHV